MPYMNQEIKLVFLILVALVFGSIYFYEPNESKCLSNHPTNALINKEVSNVTTEATFVLVDTRPPFQETRFNRSDPSLTQMSLLLQEAMLRVGRMSCVNATNDVSRNGGWCSNLSGRDSAIHLTDHNLAAAISSFLENKSVASFGDGPGAYKELILKMGQVKSYDAFDGAPYVKETTNNQVEFLDLSVPIYHLKQYDWIVSLEVAEHIPARYEHHFIDNLARHAKEGIILSWAKLGQLGHSHVNCHNSDYVRARMEERGFKHDEKATAALKDATLFEWIKENIHVYRRV
jgi:hypothetical protein